MTKTRESNGKKVHFARHGCSDAKVCTGSDQEYRMLEDDEWIKFGRVIYDSREGERKKDVLERYKIAWTAVNRSPPPALLDNGAPVNFLSNPAYTLSHRIPWFDQATFQASVPLAAPRRTPAPAIASTSSGPGTSGVQTSSSHPRSPNQTRINIQGQCPAISSTSSGSGTSGVQPSSSHSRSGVQPSSSHHGSQTKIDLRGQFPSIIGGLNNGFLEYLRSQDKLRIKVVFVLDPKFVCTKKIDVYNCTVDIHPDDARAVMEEMSGCIHEDVDQQGCEPGQKRYICMSWVRTSG
jgi:hypothetical protein